MALARDRTDIDALLCEATRGRLIREGARVAIAGKPNVGKSSLFNALLGTGRAIVTPIPGTTRDLVTDTADIHGIRIDLVDTAGVRATIDEVEIEGVSRARQAWANADLVLLVVDRSCPIEETDRDLLHETANVPRLVVGAKCDLPPAWGMRRICPSSRCRRRPASASTVCAWRCGRSWKRRIPRQRQIPLL
jgi:tRNA modification GTPase